MNTEELREQLAFLKYLDGDECVKGSVTDFVWRSMPKQGKQQYLDFADRILKVCQEVGLAFVVKDAKLPDSILKSSQLEREANKFPDCGGGDWERNIARVQRNHTEKVMLKARFRQTKEIELT